MNATALERVRLRRRWLTRSAALAGIGMLLAFPWLFGTYVGYVIPLALVSGLVTMSLNWVMGYAGQITLGQGAFFGIGAYTAAILTVQFHWPFELAMLLSAIVTGCMGFFLGFPALRLQGHYLALTTLFFSLMLPELIMALPKVTNGYRGLTLPKATTLFGARLSEPHQAYYVLLALIVCVIFVDRAMLASKLGRAFLAIRDSEAAAQSVGIPTAVYKVAAFAAAGFVAGLAGAIYGPVAGYLSPNSFTVWTSVFFFAALIIGGIGNVYGALIGGILIVALPQVFSAVQNWSGILFGMVLIAILLFLPDGIVKIGHWLRARVAWFSKI